MQSYGQQQQQQQPGMSVGGMQLQDDIQNALERLDVQARHGFIRKVFAILCLQLAVTFGVVSAFAVSEPIGNFVAENPGFYYGSMGVAFFFIILLACFTSVARKHPWGLIFLGILTVAESYVLGVIASFQDQRTVFVAIGATFAIVIGLALFAAQTKYDFTGIGPYLLVALIALIVFGVVLIFIDESRTTRTVYAAIGVLIFGMFVVYDTQLIIGGKHRKFQFSTDDYVVAALSIYLDVINIFIYMLIGTSQ